MTDTATICPTCGNLVGCTCALAARHEPSCRFVRAAQISIEIECMHGFQACPICDPCTCKTPRKEAGIR